MSVNDRLRIQHPLWQIARHLALPMLLSWAAAAFASADMRWTQPKWWIFPVVLLFSVLITATYLASAVINARYVMKVLGRGECLGCGYALWGTIKAGRWECPECGRRITQRMAERVTRLHEVRDRSG